MKYLFKVLVFIAVTSGYSQKSLIIDSNTNKSIYGKGEEVIYKSIEMGEKSSLKITDALIRVEEDLVVGDLFKIIMVNSIIIYKGSSGITNSKIFRDKGSSKISRFKCLNSKSSSITIIKQNKVIFEGDYQQNKDKTIEIGFYDVIVKGSGYYKNQILK